MDYEARYQEYQQAIEKYLDGLFTGDVAYGRLYEAMRYAILGGGKRIRPVLTLEFARLGGIDWHLALPFACALELVHNYSLIHDDLPCMDDDDLRRGKPTCHKAYGETLAVLAGDALQPEAFRLILDAPMLPADTKLEALRVLVRACGADGMVGGQVLDTVYNVDTAEGLTQLNRLKTGVMISGAAELGCVAAKMNQGIPDPGRHAGRGGRRRRVRQAYRLRQGGGQSHVRGRAGPGRLRQRGRALHGAGQGRRGKLVGSHVPVGIGRPDGGPESVKVTGSP